MAGENVVARKIERLDALMNAQFAWAQEEPRQAQQEYNDYYLKAVTIEEELTTEEADELKRKHNQSFFDELKAKHHGSRK